MAKPHGAQRGRPGFVYTFALGHCMVCQCCLKSCTLLKLCVSSSAWSSFKDTTLLPYFAYFIQSCMKLFTNLCLCVISSFFAGFLSYQSAIGMKVIVPGCSLGISVPSQSWEAQTAGRVKDGEETSTQEKSCGISYSTEKRFTVLPSHWSFKH